MSVEVKLVDPWNILSLKVFLGYVQLSQKVDIADNQSAHESVHGVAQVIDVRVATESVKAVVEEDGDAEHHAFESEPQDVVECFLSKGTPVPEHQPVQVAELVESVVSEVGRLVSFLSFDPKANVCRLDHVYIIGPISNGSCDRASKHRVSLNKSDDLGLLRGRASVDNHRFTLKH